MMWAVLYVLADQLIAYTGNYHRYLVVFEWCNLVMLHQHYNLGHR